jgi:hypothetical protein
VSAALIVAMLSLGGCLAKKPMSEPTPPPPAAVTPSPSPAEPAPATETTPPPAQPAKVGGAIEGEDLKVLTKSAGDLEKFDMSSFEGTWSKGKELFWTGGKVGDKLVLALPVAKAGKYEVKVQLTKSWDYGSVQLSLDGAPQGEAVDLYSQTVKLADLVSMGPLELEAGEHKLTLEIAGKNAAVEEGYYYVGLDYVKLVPAE